MKITYLFILILSVMLITGAVEDYFSIKEPYAFMMSFLGIVFVYTIFYLLEKRKINSDE